MAFNINCTVTILDLVHKQWHLAIECGLILKLLHNSRQRNAKQNAWNLPSPLTIARVSTRSGAATGLTKLLRCVTGLAEAPLWTPRTITLCPMFSRSCVGTPFRALVLACDRVPNLKCYKQVKMIGNILLSGLKSGTVKMAHTLLAFYHSRVIHVKFHGLRQCWTLVQPTNTQAGAKKKLLTEDQQNILVLIQMISLSFHILIMITLWNTCDIKTWFFFLVWLFIIRKSSIKLWTKSAHNKIFSSTITFKSSYGKFST